MKHFFWILLLIIGFACKNEPKQQPRKFDRYIIASTYSNNNQTAGDSLEMTNTICLDLVYLDTDGNCFIYRRTREHAPEFYKCIPTITDQNLFMDSLESLQQQFPKKYKFHGHCAPDITLLLEKKQVTDYHFIQTDPTKILKFVTAFIDQQTKDSIGADETLLKYQYYIVSKVAYMSRSRYGFEPVNNLYFNGNRPLNPNYIKPIDGFLEEKQ